MKRLLLALLLIAPLASNGETVKLDGKDYEVSVIADREIGPGIRHTRFRLPAYPLNINVLRVDMTNPYNRIETTVANESAKGTELLVNAARRQSYASHRALAGANANFWVVNSQPEDAVYTGTTRNASVRNGVIVTESNQHRDMWDGGTMRTGVVSVSTDKTLNIDYCTSFIRVTNAKFGTLEVHQVNKGVHTDELCMYNKFYGATRKFLPININTDTKKYYEDAEGDATEVILDMVEGEQYASNTPVKFKVVEVRLNKGKGTMGNHDLALVGRGDNAAKMALLAPDDEVVLNYSWIYNPGSASEVTPQVEQAVGGNALVMRGGVLTEHNSNETYNSQVYSRTGYGCSADGKMLYIIVIDKSSDPTYGTSAGCNTAKMCEFARWLGCSNMANFDAGGSAEMLVEGRIENHTTENSPRAVANGWLIYSIAPEDADDYNTIARLDFEEYKLQAPVYSKYTPLVRAYNRYGAVIDHNFTGYTLSCPPELGSCEGNVFTAAGTAATGELTASFGDVSVSKTMTVVGAQMNLRIKDLVIDAVREYPLTVTSSIGDNVYNYDPNSFEWTLSNPSIVDIDENGVLRGIETGTSDISCAIGNFSDSGTVSVEIAEAPTIGNDDWTNWTIKKSAGVSDVVVSPEGLITYTYGTPRDAYAGIAGEYRFYSLPDAVTLEFTSSLPVRMVVMDIRSALHTRNNNINLKKADGTPFEAGVKHTVNVPIAEVADLSDLASFPLKVCGMNFKVSMDNSYKGQQQVQINALYGTYQHFSALKETEIAESTTSVTPNPVAAGAALNVRGNEIESIEIYNVSGMRVARIMCNGADDVTVDAPSTGGLYFVRVAAADGCTTHRVIVK